MTRPQSQIPASQEHAVQTGAHVAQGLLTWQPLPREGVRLWLNENQILCMFKPLSISSDVASCFPKQSFVFRGLKGKRRSRGPAKREGRGGVGRGERGGERGVGPRREAETGPQAGLPVNWAAGPVFPITWGAEPICGKTGWKICGGRKRQITGDSCSPPGQGQLSARACFHQSCTEPGQLPGRPPQSEVPPSRLAAPGMRPQQRALHTGLLPGPPTPLRASHSSHLSALRGVHCSVCRAPHQA